MSEGELSRLAKELFAQVRAEHPPEVTRDRQGAGDAAGKIGGDLFDWLLDGGDGDDAGGGDCD